MEVGGLMQPDPQHDRRTGVAFLSLVAATNVIPWMELLLGQTADAEPLAPSEIRIAIGTCVLALASLLCAWFSRTAQSGARKRLDPGAAARGIALRARGRGR
jgi:hypothetical protein